MKRNFRLVKERREDFLHYFKSNFEKYFDLNRIDLDEAPNAHINLGDNHEQEGFRCSSCDSGQIICKTSKTGTLYLGCNNFPTCKSVYFFSPKIKQFQLLEEACNICQSKMVA